MSLFSENDILCFYAPFPLIPRKMAGNTVNSSKTMDALDWRILAALQQNGRLSYAALGRQVGLSASAVTERVHRLEADGVIAGYTAVINPKKVGLSVTAIIRWRVAAIHCAQVQQTFKETREIVECHKVTGSDAFVMKIVASSVDQLEAVVGRLTALGEVVTSVVLASPVEGRGFIEQR